MSKKKGIIRNGNSVTFYDSDGRPIPLEGRFDLSNSSDLERGGRIIECAYREEMISSELYRKYVEGLHEMGFVLTPSQREDYEQMLSGNLLLQGRRRVEDVYKEFQREKIDESQLLQHLIDINQETKVSPMAVILARERKAKKRSERKE